MYGADGDHHGGFDHEGLADILKERSKWVLSYNNCDYVRNLYNGYKILEVEWTYGMKNVGSDKMGKSSELLIVNK